MKKTPLKKASRMTTSSKKPHLLVAAPDGTVYEHPTFEMALDNGATVLRWTARDTIALPDAWDLMAMPGTIPVGYNPLTGHFEEVTSFTAVNPLGKEVTFVPCAVACHPPPGYVRGFHPAARYLTAMHPDEAMRLEASLVDEVNETVHAIQKNSKMSLNVVETGGDDGARPGLPLWAYTAVGVTEQGIVAALIVADETSRWAPQLYYKPNIESKIQERLKQEPDNPVLKQLSECATNYLCCCAQNVFYERWEGAVPMAPACTARCLGCLSKDPEWDTPVPQKRLKFQPTPEHIASVMAHHLENAQEPMMSFGQGCEGEPTMNGPVIIEAIRLTREKTSKGIININTNGSRPETIAACAKAGATALRISLNTFDRDVYTMYYRPQDYNYDDVMKSFFVGRDHGMHISINLLIWPGWTDRMAEVDAISKMVEAGALHMVQWRNLCVDPGYYRQALPPLEKRGILMTMRGFMEELHRRHPALRFGTFNPRLAAPWYKNVPSWVKQTAWMQTQENVI
jgi:pyruvate-formate lyase-activating enzyme